MSQVQAGPANHLANVVKAAQNHEISENKQNQVQVKDDGKTKTITTAERDVIGREMKRMGISTREDAIAYLQSVKSKLGSAYGKAVQALINDIKKDGVLGSLSGGTRFAHAPK